MNNKIKPCPFCGGEASIVEVTERPAAFVEEAFIQCEECGFSFHHKWLSAETLIKYWNTRHERTCHIESSTYDEECDCVTTKLSCGCVVIDGWSFHGKYCPECGARVVN